MKNTFGRWKCTRGVSGNARVHYRCKLEANTRVNLQYGGDYQRWKSRRERVAQGEQRPRGTMWKGEEDSEWGRGRRKKLGVVDSGSWVKAENLLSWRPDVAGEGL